MLLLVLGNSGVRVVIALDDHGVTLGNVGGADLVVVVDGGVVVGDTSALSVLPHSDGAVVRRSDKGGVDSGEVVALGVLVGLDVDGLDSGAVALAGHVEEIHLGGVLVVDLVADVSLKQRCCLHQVDAGEDDDDAELHGWMSRAVRFSDQMGERGLGPRDHRSIYTLPV